MESIAIYLDQKGLKDVRITGFSKSGPRPIKDKDGNEYVPDITARHFQSKHIYQLVPDDPGNSNEQLDMWRFFSEYTGKTGGRLVLVVRTEVADDYQSIFDEQGIAVHFLKMKSM